MANRQNVQRVSLRHLSSYQDTHSIKGVLGVPIPFDEVSSQCCSPS